MKPHLVLVHSFPTNSILLQGLNQFLSDYFTVHFIDLPGFHKNSPPLKGTVTLKKFSNYLDQRITELDADEYIVGGVSFGFLVINNARLDARCKAILAIEPFINSQCLNIPFWKRRIYSVLAVAVKVVSFFQLEKRIWESVRFHNYLQHTADYPIERVLTIIQHLDARTFFSVTRIIMNYRERPKFHALPHFLIGNFADNTINFSAAVEIFIKHLHELHITSVPVEHYPKELTKHYFQTRIPQEHIHRMVACVKGGTSF